MHGTVERNVFNATGKFRRFASVVGPGIFAIGYTIGTGSVTSMAKAGADYGLGLLWVLALRRWGTCPRWWSLIFWGQQL